VVALSVAAFRSPLGEGLQPVAVFPGKLEEFLCVQIGGFFAKERFKAPLEIRALPGLQTVAARGYPVVSQGCPHELDSNYNRILRADRYSLRGTERCSWTNTQDLPRFSQMPV